VSRKESEAEKVLMAEVPDGFRWPPPWKPLPLPEGWLGLARSVEAELQSEVCPSHLLYRVACRVVAFNTDDVNEFLFASNSPRAQVAFVHLTFKAETIHPAFSHPSG
jgi:hypothetical protein